MKNILKILGAVVVVYLLILLYFLVRQKTFIYVPSKEMTETPDVLGIKWDDITFESVDGTELNGWFIPAELDSNNTTEQCCILYSHGNAGNLSDRMATIDIVHRFGLPLFIYDYRGFGKSGGEPSAKGLYMDQQAAYNYLTQEKGFKPENIIYHGRSLGGSIAARGAKEGKGRGLVLESTFTSVADLASDMYPFLPIKLHLLHNQTTLDDAIQTDCPVLVIHSPEDDVIPFHHGKQLAEALGNRAEFLEIQGNHDSGFLSTGEAFEKGLYDFYTSLIESQ
mgnify:CR=1 FL=1